VNIFLETLLQLDVFSSFHELMQSRGVRRPSVCKLFCANRFFYHRSGWIATKLAHDGPHMGLHPRCAQGQGQGQRSRDTDNFVISRKSLILAGRWLDRDQTCTRWSPYGPRVCSMSRSRSKVTWYGHFCDVTKCLVYSTFWRSVSTRTHFTKHRYTLLPVQVSDLLRQLDIMSSTGGSRHGRTGRPPPPLTKSMGWVTGKATTDCISPYDKAGLISKV